MNPACPPEKELLQDLAHRHEDVLLRLEELDNAINGIIDEYLGKGAEANAASDT